MTASRSTLCAHRLSMQLSYTSAPTRICHAYALQCFQKTDHVQLDPLSARPAALSFRFGKGYVITHPFICDATHHVFDLLRASRPASLSLNSRWHRNGVCNYIPQTDAFTLRYYMHDRTNQPLCEAAQKDNPEQSKALLNCL